MLTAYWRIRFNTDYFNRTSLMATTKTKMVDWITMNSSITWPTRKKNGKFTSMILTRTSVVSSYVINRVNGWSALAYWHCFWKSGQIVSQIKVLPTTELCNRQIFVGSLQDENVNEWTLKKIPCKISIHWPCVLISHLFSDQGWLTRTISYVCLRS